MSRFLRVSIMVTALLLISACFLTECGTPEAQPNSVLDALSQRVQAQPTTYTAPGQVINYSIVLSNNGTTPLSGTLAITETNNRVTITCPQTNVTLNVGENITCTASYTTNQADVTAGSVTISTVALLGSQMSNTVTTTVNVPPNPVLSLAITASPTTYSQTGQVITFSYTITNTGAASLGPAQFVIQGDRIQSPLNCGQPATLATNQAVTCSATYSVTQADMDAPQITHTATASGAGATTVQTASVTVTRAGAAPAPGSGAYTRGTTIRHPVSKGEWLIQITRCYGANYEAVRNANLQIKDPHWIYPLVDTVTVPNIGSDGNMYGPPCIKFYIVKSGDTWQSIANDPAHNADIEVLREANQTVTLSPGQEIKVPLNSRQSGIVVTPLPPTPIPARQPIPLDLSAANPNVTVANATIGTPDTIRYVFTGAAGQTLTVTLTVATNDLRLGVYGPNAAVLKPLDTILTWTGPLTASGEHTIEIASSQGSGNKTYTLVASLAAPVPVSPFERVADINTGAGDSNPSHLAVFNGQLYFQATGDAAGAELWKYDSTTRTPSRVADINPGAGGSDPSFLVPFTDNMLYFRANGNDGAGAELWRFNGTNAGRVFDLNRDLPDTNPMYLTLFNGALYFSANGNDGKGVELWRFDANNVTARISDINPDAGDSNPAHLEVFNNALYFSATSNDGTGTELWRYDGTTTERVADINPQVGNSNPAFLTVFNNALYFSANGNDNTGTELWRYDGTTPPVRVADVNPGAADSVPTYLTVFNNALYFSAAGDTTGFELWKFDGTNATRVGDLNTAGDSKPAYLTVYNNELYFQANGNDGAGLELWKFKGP